MSKSREEYSEELENQYRRMERSHDLVLEDFQDEKRSKSAEQMLDSAESFFVSAYHLREWVKKDSKVSAEVKSRLPSFEGEKSPVQFLICRDLCNKSKHASLEEKRNHKPNDVNTRIEKYGGAVFKISFDELKSGHEKKETIHLKDSDSVYLGNFLVVFRGNNYDLKGVVQGCMYEWKKFFEENDLLLPRTTPYKN